MYTSNFGNNIIANIRILQLDPAHPLAHMHLLGEVHCLLVPQDGLHIAGENIVLYVCLQLFNFNSYEGIVILSILSNTVFENSI